MAVAKIILFDSPSKRRKDDTFPICLRVTNQRKRRYFTLGRYCTADQWNKEGQKFNRKYPNSSKENKELNRILTRANGIIFHFDKSDTAFSFEVFETKFLRKEQQHNLASYFDKWITIFTEEGRIGTASPYKTTINSIMQFCSYSKRHNSSKLKLTSIDYRFLSEFEHWLRVHRNCKDTTISVYMRTLRSILNKAIKEKLITSDSYPFGEYEISKLNTSTIKRAITKEDVKKLEALEFEEFSRERLAQDVFLFSYYTRGMNFVDISLLTEKNIKGDRLVYIREKTQRKKSDNKILSIKLLPKAKSIIEFYQNNKLLQGNYIFPVYEENRHVTPNQMRNRRKSMLRDINRRLKLMAKDIGLEDLNLTSYVSRHTYATVHKKAGTSIAKISEALGHSDIRTTQIYLKEFDNEEMDKADEEIL